MAKDSDSAIPTQEQRDGEEVREAEKEIKQEKINDLKLQVLNSKAQMSILKHLIRNEGVSKTYPKVNISFKNDMSERYILHSVKYTIDGEDVFTYFRDDENSSSKKIEEIQPFEGALAPGTHNLVIRILFQGNDSGIFSYISDYRAKSEGQISFQVEKGSTTKIEVNAFEKGWMLTEFKDRPDMKVLINGNVSEKLIKF